MILWLLLLFGINSFAQDQAIEEYCFSTHDKMNKVHAKLKFILVPIDKVEKNNNCFTISTAVHRRELIQGYVTKLDPNAQVSFSSANIGREHCHIKVEKVRTAKENNFSAAGPRPTLTSQQGEQNSKSTTSIQTSKEFELTVNQESIKGECRAINSSRYEIALTVSKNSRPLLPPVPPGTTIVIPEGELPPPQETSILKTTVQLNRGEKIEVGSIVTELKNNSSHIELSHDAKIEKSKESGNEKIFLSIE